MITTPESCLAAVSRRLKETVTDTSSLRVGYFNDSGKHILSLYKWGWSRRKHDLDVDDGVQTYDLTSEISDYSPERGIWEVYVGGEKIDPVNYDRRDSAVGGTQQKFYLDPTDKTIGFTKDLDGTEDIDIWYYASWTDASLYNSTLTLPLPENILILFALYMKHLVHDGKRQRYDARNALLDFQEVLQNIIAQQGSSKIKDLPRHVPKLYAYTGFKRVYER